MLAHILSGPSSRFCVIWAIMVVYVFSRKS